MKTKKSASKKFFHQNPFVFTLILLLVCALFVTVSSVQHQQIFTQHAAEPSPSDMTFSQTRHVFYGVYVPGKLSSLSTLTRFENDAKKKVSLVLWYQGWGVTDGTQNFQPSWMNTVRSHGSYPVVSWMPWDPGNGTPNQPQYALHNIINGNFDSYITQWANASKAWGHPYFLRFAYEMNGYWFPWDESFQGHAINGNKPGEYVKAWQHVHALFQSVGVTNVTWVWSPNIDFNGTLPLAKLYPGDAVVDWTGMDGYNWGTLNQHSWQSFSQVFTQTYSDISSLTAKPLMVAETASTETGGNKANWITDAYTTQIPNSFPKIKGIIWFNEDKTNQGETNWTIESSGNATRAFASADQAGLYTTNSYASASSSPIPAP